MLQLFFSWDIGLVKATQSCSGLPGGASIYRWWCWNTCAILPIAVLNVNSTYVTTTAWGWIPLPHMSNIICFLNAAIERFSKIRHTGAQLAIVAMAPLEAVDQLSDDEVPEPSPMPAPRPPALRKPKASARASGSSNAPKPKPAPKKDAKPKATLKRPAASEAAAVLKRPASRGGRVKDPNHISVCASKYKSTGVWSIKLAQKEVIRVTWWHCRFIIWWNWMCYHLILMMATWQKVFNLRWSLTKMLRMRRLQRLLCLGDKDSKAMS